MRPRVIGAEDRGARLYGELIALLAAGGRPLCVAAITLPNPASVALHERMGFQPIGEFRQGSIDSGMFCGCKALFQVIGGEIVRQLTVGRQY